MNGQYYLIKKVGTKVKFYWAPLAPWPVKDFEDWGVAVVDASWRTEDPRPKHLRATPLGYALQPAVQVLRDPKIDEVRDDRWRHCCLGYHLPSALYGMTRRKPYTSWASG